MNPNTNMLYKDEEIAKIQGELMGNLKQIPAHLQADANKALGDMDSVKIPKKSDDTHMKNLAEFAESQRNMKGKKKKRNRSASQSRRKNRR